MPGLPRSLICLLVLATPAAAQVGHDPQHSPYREITSGAVFAPQVSFLRGDGGRLGIVPNAGLLFGARAELLANRPVTLGLEFAYGQAERLIVDPDEDGTVRGPVDQSIGIIGATIFLNLTGGKTWNRIAPYVGGAGGIAFAPHVASDTSGYKYGVKFQFAPTAGVRFFLAPNVFLRAEARSVFTSISYPASYASTVLEGEALKEWVTAGLYTLSLGLPFPRIF